MREYIGIISKIRIINIVLFVLLSLSHYYGKLLFLMTIFSFLHIVSNFVFFTSELIYMIYKKSARHIYRNWLVLLGFFIILIELLILIRL
jgi:hypothetical protein